MVYRLKLGLGILLVCLLGPVFAEAQIARTGTCAGAPGSSCTFSATATGDLKIIFAFDSGSRTIPSLPSGWTSIATLQTTTGGTTGAIRIGCNKSSSGSDTGSGTWTNATTVVGISYSGTGVGTTANCNTTGIGGKGTNNAKTSTSANFPTISMTNADSSSWVAGFMGGTATSGTISCAPTGMQSQTTSGTGPQARASDTNGVVNSWSSTSCTVASETWLSAVEEILATQVATPAYDNGAGTYTGHATVTITDSTSGSTIKYCTDSVNTCNPLSGTTYSSPVTIQTTGTYLRAQATKTGWVNSAIQSALYTINPFVSTAAETCTSVDTCTTTWTQPGIPAETVTTSDSAATSGGAKTAAAAETTTTSDAATTGIKRVLTASEGCTSTDEAGCTQTITQSGPSETVGVADAASHGGLAALSASETVTTSDAATIPKVVWIMSASDTTATADVAAIPKITKPADEAVTTSDLAVIPGTLRTLTASDTTTTADAASFSNILRVMTAADTTTTADSASPLGKMNRAIPETVTTADAAGTTAGGHLPASDSVVTADSAIPKSLLHVAVPDTTTTADSATPKALIHTAASESCSSSDAATCFKVATQTGPSDTVTTADSASAISGNKMLASETVATADAAVGHIHTTLAATETCTSADSAACFKTATQAGPAETVGVVAAVTVITGSKTFKNIAEASATSDVAAAARHLAASDTCTTGDLASCYRVTVQGGQPQEAVATFDVAVTGAPKHVNATETVTTSDAPLLCNLTPGPAESSATVDTLIVGIRDVRLPADTTTTSDAASTVILPKMLAVEGITIADVIQQKGKFRPPTSDTVSVADQLQTRMTANRSASETVTVADSASSSIIVIQVQASDASATSDAAAANLIAQRAATDQVGTVEFALIATEGILPAAEFPIITDVLQTKMSANRQPAETVAVVDGASTHVVEFIHVPAVDIVAVTDSAVPQPGVHHAPAVEKVEIHDYLAVKVNGRPAGRKKGMVITGS